jgi:2-polyprenyl-6-methoxyphenol hydroxylase-like FAD-dependent oxidoreductase
MALLPQSRTEAILRDLIKERNILFETGTALTDISSNMNKVIVKVSKGGETPV